jgi:phosphopantetheinyl transferase
LQGSKIKLKIEVMPIFFQQQINETTRLGIWKIEETEEFFKSNVPLHRDVTHPHKRLQHLAGRFLLQYLFPAFPYSLIKIADTRKPYLPNEEYHFSISHCGDFAAVIVSKDKRVGIDIEIPTEKILRIQNKFLSDEEKKQFTISNPQSENRFPAPDSRLTTLFWSAKESVYKWYGDGGVDFKENILLKQIRKDEDSIDCFFTKNKTELSIHYRQFDHLVLAWVVS